MAHTVANLIVIVNDKELHITQSRMCTFWLYISHFVIDYEHAQVSSSSAEDASVSECTWTRSALEALRNALYKFKTYLLTY